MTHFFIKTLGCKVNTFDTDAIHQKMLKAGHTNTAQVENADVVIVNTCSVTHNADKEARYLARSIRKQNPNTCLVFTGCYAQTDSAKLVSMPEINLVIPNEVKDKLPEQVNSFLKNPSLTPKIPEGTVEVSENRQGHFKSSVTFFDKPKVDRHRAFVKIQDGCNGFCTYCLIPYARGQSSSVEPNKIIESVKELLSEGVQEIVLTGIHVGDYGNDIQENNSEGQQVDLANICERICLLPQPKRLRISSLEPSEVSSRFLNVAERYQDIFCNHFHLPLQSGCDEILTKMRRSYTTDEYFNNVQSLKSIMPDACLGADIMGGFPGETDEQHQETIEFIKKCGLHYLHVFPYSKRPNTAAIKMPGHVDPKIIKERCSELRELSKELFKNYQSQFIGKTLSVIWEKDTKNGYKTGVTRNFLKIHAKNKNPENLLTIKGFHSEQNLFGTYKIN